jgi:hypothetical protein
MAPASRAPSLLLVALLVTALVYWPGLSGGFIFDDFPNIVQKQHVHAESIDAESLELASRAYGGLSSRPLATVSFAMNHVAGGLEPWGYKFTNLMVHLLNTLLVFLVVRRLLPLSNAPSRWGDTAAVVVALLWAVHPLQVSTVFYVVQRMEMLSATFVLLGLWAYLQGRQRQISGSTGWPWLLACLPLLVLSLLSKESGILLPAFTLALELTVLGFAARNPAAARAWRLAYAAGAAAAMLVFLLVAVPHYAASDAYAIRDYSLAERLMTQLRVLPTYLGWIVLPRPASFVFYYDSYPASQGLLQPVTTLLGGLFLLVLVATALVLRRRLPIFSLGIFWFFAAHALTSNIAPLELVFEHRNYFAILGVLLAIAELVRRIPLGDTPRIRQLTIAVLVLGMLGLTLIRSATWGNPLGLAMELVSKNPDSPRASLDLGELLLRKAANDSGSRFFKLGIAELERGSRVPNASPLPEQGLIVYSALAGVPANPEWWDRVIHKLETRAIGPQETSMIVDMLRMRNEGVAFDDARYADAYQVLVERIWMPPFQYYAFGEHALKFLQDKSLAASLFNRAIEQDKSDVEFAAAVAQALLSDGHADMAQSVITHARSLGMAEIQLPDAPKPEAAANPSPEERVP